MKFEPSNEQGVVALFCATAATYGLELISIQAAYPDAILRDDGGEEWRTEFEFYASSFVEHRHDHRECDLIVCWENDYPDCPIPILSLKNGIRIDLAKALPSEKAAEYWMLRCIRAEREAKDSALNWKAVRSISEKLVVAGRAKIDNRRAIISDAFRKDPDIKIVTLMKLVGASRNTVKEDMRALGIAGEAA